MNVLSIILLILVGIVLIFGFIFSLNFKKIVKLFQNHSVSVTGEKGSGKDLIFGNVIARRKLAYVGNMDYGGKFHLLDFDKLDCGGNNYENFINGNIHYYSWEYPVAADVYISDAGVYFPAQYNGELNKRYKTMPTFMALSRQIADVKVHSNQQCFNRVWDKIREHSERYINCNWCRYIKPFGLVIQKVTIYDRAESCQAKIPPCKVSVPLFNANAKMMAKVHKDSFYNSHGEVKSMILVYFNKSKHDSYRFGNLMKAGRHYAKD